MTTMTDINPRIVESLYNDALILADEVRAAFDLSTRPAADEQDEDLTRVALSCEALRTTTRMMQAIAWLLNQRAYFNGEISEVQLRRHGRLPKNKSKPDPEQLDLIDPETRELIECSELLYARVARLDRALEAKFAMERSAFVEMQEQLVQRVGVGG